MVTVDPQLKFQRSSKGELVVPWTRGRGYVSAGFYFVACCAGNRFAARVVGSKTPRPELYDYYKLLARDGIFLVRLIHDA